MPDVKGRRPMTGKLRTRGLSSAEEDGVKLWSVAGVKAKIKQEEGVESRHLLMLALVLLEVPSKKGNI